MNSDQDSESLDTVEERRVKSVENKCSSGKKNSDSQKNLQTLEGLLL